MAGSGGAEDIEQDPSVWSERLERGKFLQRSTLNMSVVKEADKKIHKKFLKKSKMSGGEWSGVWSLVEKWSGVGSLALKEKILKR